MERPSGCCCRYASFSSAVGTALMSSPTGFCFRRPEGRYTAIVIPNPGFIG